MFGMVLASLMLGTLTITTTHCEAIAINAAFVSSVKATGQSMELTLAETVYAYTTAPEGSLVREVMPFVYQVVPVVYEVDGLTFNETFNAIHKRCMRYVGQSVPVPPMR